MPKLTTPAPKRDISFEPEPEDLEITEPVTETPKPVKKTSKLPAAPSLFLPLTETREFLRILYWGREGSGKTTDALTLANIGKIVVVNAEGGLKKNTLAKRGVNVDNVVVYPLPGQPITHEGLDEVYRTIKADLEQDPDSWAGVIFDSATDVVQALVDSVSNDRIAKARNRGANIDQFDTFFTDRGDYGTMSKMFRDLLRKFRDLQAHFIVTALERRDVDEDTSKVTYGPAVTPGIQNDLLGYVDIVLHTKEADDDNPFYRALTKKAGKFRTKDRLDALPRILVNPTAERVIAYVNEEITENTDPVQAVLSEEKASGKLPPK
jgi:hypothetical protein